MMEQTKWLPLTASTFAIKDDKIMAYMMVVSLIFSVGIFVTLIFFAWKYRHRPGNEVSRFVPVSYALEITWTLVPLAISSFAFFWGAKTYLDMLTPRDSAETILLVGKQWMWKVEHENGVSEINELHVPVGRDVNLVMISQDVIHSFSVPDFRVKYDVLPGRYTRVWFRAEKPGSYRIFCTQYCGTDHSKMIGAVEAMTNSDYEIWLEGNRPISSATLGPLDKGRHLFESQGCVSCHENKSNGADPIGPPLQGRFLAGDENAIRNALIRPSSSVAAGYQDVMPTYAGILDETDIYHLIRYLTVAGTKHD